MRTPLQRMHANRETRHHLLFEKPEWTAQPRPKQVRELGAYVVGVKRAPHDYLHATIQPVPVPTNDVLDAMMDIGREYVGWQNDQDRLDRMNDSFTGYAIGTRSPENAHGMLTIISSIEAQLAIIGTFQAMRGIRYE